MEYAEAELILNPKTTLVALGEIEYYAGLKGAKARKEAVDEACIVACEALNKGIEKKVTHEASLPKCCTCPNCKNALDQFDEFFGQKVRIKPDYCYFCGQKLDWDSE